MVVLLAAVAPVAPAADSDFSRRLRQADALRSADPVAFRRLLAELERAKATATPHEQDYLSLLRDYRDAIDGRYGDALGDAVALYDRTSDPELKYRAAVLVANAAATTRDFLLGLRYLENALRLQDTLRRSDYREYASLVASTLYNEYGRPDLALHYAQRVLASDAAPRTKCFARQNLIASRLQIGARGDLTADAQRALAYCLALREPIPAGFIRATLAKAWARQGRTAQAIRLLEAHLPEAERTGYTRLIGDYYSLLAEYRFARGDVDAAEAYARRVVGLKGQELNPAPSGTAHHILYRIALARGDYRTALDEYRRYADADKARLDDVKAREFAFQQSRHELNRKEHSIALLLSRNRLLSLQQEAAQRTAWNFRLAIVLLLLVAASFACWGWRARRTHGSLRQLAEIDSLTGLANRRHFRACAEAALAQSAASGRPVSVLLFDLDHFKQINDRCGHAAGDWVLREVARVGRLHCREGDLFGRIGGEEFAMMLPGCDIDAALRTAEACRRAIAAVDAAGAGCALPVSASIGVAYAAHSGYDYEALIAHADAAMYRSKVGGRNRVTCYEPPPVPPPGHSAPMLDRRNANTMLRQY